MFWTRQQVDGNQANAENEKCLKLLGKIVIPLALFAGFLILLALTCGGYRAFPRENCIRFQANRIEEVNTQLGALPTSSLAGQRTADSRSHITVLMGYWSESNTSHASTSSVFTPVEVGGGEEVELKSRTERQDQAVGDGANQGETLVDCMRLWEKYKKQHFRCFLFLGALLVYTPWLFNSALYVPLIAGFYLLGTVAFFFAFLILDLRDHLMFLNEWFVLYACAAALGCFIVATATTVIGFEAYPLDQAQHEPANIV